jgi:putative chitinase
MASTLHVLANKLNLRVAPETGRVVAVLRRGQLLDVVTGGAGPSIPGWIRVTTMLDLGSVEGFVAERYVAEVGAAAGSDPLADGTLRVTIDKLQRLTPTGRNDILDALAREFDVVGASYGLTTSAARVCHFLAQAAHESMGFSRLRELGGPSYFKRYEGRTDLGNVHPGDGVKFHGRGIFQLTGRANYAAMSKLLGNDVDLVADPDRAMQPSMSLRIACIFWSKRRLNDLADANDIGTITKRINGGHNGLADRTHLWEKARTIWT